MRKSSFHFQSAPRRRDAFTLRELLVVVTLVAIGFAILIPLIHSAREASRRSSCSNNLKQVAIAVHNYHLNYKHCPSAMFGTPANQHRLSGRLVLTEFMSAAPFWGTVSNPSAFGGKNYPALGPVPWDANYDPWCREFPTFRCPSDPGRGPKLGRTNYVFCVGDEATGLYGCSSLNDVRGMFAPGMTTKFRNILDGLSNTIMMTEIGTARGRYLAGQFATGHSTAVANSPKSCLSLSDPQSPLFYKKSAQLSDLGRGGAFADGAGGYSLVSTILPPNSPSCAIGSQAPYDGIFSAGSYHADGCHVLMADGAVNFMGDSIDHGDLTQPAPTKVRSNPPQAIGSPYGLWGALGTRASMETIDARTIR